MQSEMGCHLILRWVCNPLGDILLGWKVSTGVGWFALHVGQKNIYYPRTPSISNFFLLVLALLVLGGGSKSYLNEEVKFRS